MLTQKLASKALWPSVRLTKAPSPGKELTSSPLRANRTASKPSLYYNPPQKRTYLSLPTKTSRNPTKGKKVGKMLVAAATTATVVIGGSAAYSTSAEAQQSQDRPTATSTNTPTFESAAFQIPHPEKKYKGGEDTLFVSSNSLVVGVFDGVGGWADSGVDPREYALKLSQGAQEATDKKGFQEPLEVLRYAHKYSNKVTGSSTACVVALKGSNLVSANLGDSGYLVVRLKENGEVQLLFKSEELQHGFNFPYQLGPQSSDRPDHADIHTMPVQIGDLVILGTDGLFDNVDERQICQIVQTVVTTAKGEIKLDNIAQTIANEAFKVSQNKRAMSPFAKNALAHGYSYQGGKPDDITVLVSRVSTLGEASTKNQAPSKSAPTTDSNSNTGASTGNTYNFQSVPQSDDSAFSSSSSTTSMASSILQRLMGFRPWTAPAARL